MTDKMTVGKDRGTVIVLDAYSGSDGLLEAALYFADQRIQHATKCIIKGRAETPSRTRLRRKFADTALKQAESQIKAARALIRIDLEDSE